MVALVGFVAIVVFTLRMLPGLARAVRQRNEEKAAERRAESPLPSARQSGSSDGGRE